MEAGGKDCEEETLQTAFKKLRVDAESSSGAANASDASTPRAPSRLCLDSSSGAKAKLSCPKDTWHCCTRKSSRGTSSRVQRRRRSKSPILHPPRFTYCSGAASTLAPPAGCLAPPRLVLSEPAEPRLAAERVPAAERPSSAAPGRGSPVLFGVRPSYDTQAGGAGSSAGGAAAAAPSPRWDGGRSGDVGSGQESGSDTGSSDAADFRALSELHRRSSVEEPRGACRCSRTGPPAPGEEGEADAGPPRCRCGGRGPGWSGVEVYSFTGLRSVISECEGGPSIRDDEPRTVSGGGAASSPLASGSPRSCSEEARGYVDDITIEDLSGYMEYYLYIPKKMSHMAEMMYT
ncbi:oxidative stress-responsive serine-rich protein 1 [Fundulus heteroclitus]|uniref:oxidative stress-responsive serine-rich protein 1 n=1 Tax=Fundulus heteroclitus TaxID=8078 RepID=UPI00165B7911|nr:oxidative stress-responsive serine-rich protein 1 [Fundulus heteroclitus]